MSEIQLIEGVLTRACKRRRLERAWRGFWKGLFFGALVWFVVFALFKLAPVPPQYLTAAAIVCALVPLVWAIVMALKPVTMEEMARWVDSKKKLQERLSTAMEISKAAGSAEWKQLVLTDAAEHVREIDPARMLPFRFPAIGKWAFLAIAMAVALAFVPTFRTKAYVQKQNELANVKETGKKLTEFIKRTIEQRPPALEPTQKAMEAVTEMGQKLTQANLTRGEALKDLAKLEDKLSEQNKELSQNPNLKPLERAARERESGSTGAQLPEALQKQMDALQKSLGNAAGNPDALDKLKKDLEKAKQTAANLPDKDSAAGKAAGEQLSKALSELAKQAADMGQPLASLEEAIKALENNQTDLALRDLQTALTDLDKVRDMAKSLQQLQQQAAKMGKDLAEQLKNGQAQAAQQTLQKMIDQLKTANLSQEQLQKIAEEVSKAVDPAGQYGKVGEHLKNALQQMQEAKKQGSNPSQKQQSKDGAAQDLAAAAKELEKLQQQMADAQALQEALEGLEKAQMALASGKQWSETSGMCKACNGLGCSLCKGKGWGRGGKPGGGVGTWADETGWTTIPEMQAVDNSGVTRPDMAERGQTDRGDGEKNPALTPTKVRGQMSQGGPMPSITLKGVSIKGQSSVQYQEAAASAQSEAQNALSQDQVPRAYRGAVRDYFDDLKK
ncbi:MAG TPA: hypothetical protein VMZ27_07110 [Candidatus Saccharimonadales bacterium]|nr:hypothetical protein [Candidatus Saccharimonadales bacterium]